MKGWKHLGFVGASKRGRCSTKMGFSYVTNFHHCWNYLTIGSYLRFDIQNYITAQFSWSHICPFGYEHIVVETNFFVVVQEIYKTKFLCFGSLIINIRNLINGFITYFFQWIRHEYNRLVHVFFIKILIMHIFKLRSMIYWIILATLVFLFFGVLFILLLCVCIDFIIINKNITSIFWVFFLTRLNIFYI